jgi:hypothetical protein
MKGGAQVVPRHALTAARDANGLPGGE